MQRPSLALAAALAVALLALPLTIRGGRVPAPGEATPVRLDMRVDGGAVRIAWRDGRDKAYTVRRSVDAAGVASGEAHVVRGNVWVDDRPESSPIVFYTVE